MKGTHLVSFVLGLALGASLAPLGARAEDAPAATGCAPKVRLRGPVYAPHFAGLEPGLAEILDEVAEQFPKLCPGRSLLIEAHATELATPELNQHLSELRALTIRDELAKRGIPRERLIAVGVGDSRPEVPATDPDARQMNRRITFRAVD